jgi:hypothetical protein
LTIDTYERATEIKNRIDYLENVDSLLINASHQNNLLAAISGLTTYSNIDVKNKMPLDVGLLVKLRVVIRDEIDQLHREFEEL